MKTEKTKFKNDNEDFKKRKKPNPQLKHDPARKNKKHYLQNHHEYI